MKRPRPKKTGAVSPLIEVNGWRLFAHPLFIDQIEKLACEVEQLRKKDPDGYREKKKTKLLAAIRKVAFETIPADPANRGFLQGNTLGAPYRHWHRAKFFEGRYRLFFRYASAEKAIVLAWINDEESLRTYGSRTDVYAVFARMLDNGNPPDDWNALLKAAREAIPRAGKFLKPGT
jgi:toxin YhaV